LHQELHEVNMARLIQQEYEIKLALRIQTFADT
jgi:hypothetical protein